MTQRYFHSVAALVAALEAVAGSLDTLTLDLFDTLVIRRIADPDQIKIPVARYIAARASRAGLDCSWQECLRLRAEIEQAQRRQNGALYPDQEARYPEFMGELLARIFGRPLPARLLDDVTEWELRLEQAVIVPRAALVELLRRWQAAGKRIWVMTDIYLPSTHIRPLLESCGIWPYLTGVVSSADACMAKASGAGFRRLQEQQGLNPARWAHVGDNPFSDGARPAELGIRAFVLRDAAEAQRHAIYRRYAAAAAARPFWKGRLLQQLMLPLEAENQPRDQRYAFGWHVLGPLTGGFIQHIAERARALQLRRIYFFAREGHTLLRAWELARPWLFPDGGAPEARYLYVSRLALAGASCAQRGLTHAAAPLALLPASSRDFRDIARVFGLDLDLLMPFLQRHGLPATAPLNPIYSGWTRALWQSFDRLLQDGDFQAEVRRQTRPPGRLLERYLEQQGFFELAEVGVVDIGWLGTIQRFLYEAIEHRPDKPKLHGLLLGATRGIPYPSSPTNNIEGYIYDRARAATSGNAISYALNIFEEAFRAPHAGVLGYTEQAGQVRPVLQPESDRERLREIEQNALNAPLQEALCAAVPRYAAGAQLLGLSAADVKPWLVHLLTMRLAFPRRDEVAQLQRQHHADQYTGAHRPPWRIRLYLLRLWDLPPWLLLVPGLRLACYAWTTLAVPSLRQALRLARALLGRLRRLFKKASV